MLSKIFRFVKFQEKKMFGKKGKKSSCQWVAYKRTNISLVFGSEIKTGL